MNMASARQRYSFTSQVTIRARVDDGALTTYTYNGDGLRLQTKKGATTSTMVWDGSDYAQVKRSTGTNSLFVVLDGEVVGEDLGGTLRDFVVDPLGSVVGHLNSSGAITNAFEFWPYGESSGGTRASGTFQWVGSEGYYADPGTRTYIRAREYEQSIGSWLQLDLLWPDEQPYGYVRGRAINAVDPTGMQLGPGGYCIACANNAARRR
jgi:RHS repeat-associated protein